MLTYNKNNLKSKINKLFLWIVYLLCFILIISISRVNAQEKCKTAFQEAQSMYEVGRTLEVISLLTLCLPDDIPEEQRAKAFELLALAYVEEGLINEAKDTIKRLLATDKNYRPDTSIHPAIFVELVQDTIKRSKANKRVRTCLLLAGGGIAVTVIVIALTSIKIRKKQKKR